MAFRIFVDPTMVMFTETYIGLGLSIDIYCKTTKSRLRSLENFPLFEMMIYH